MSDKESSGKDGKDSSDKAADRAAAKDSAKEEPMERAYNDHKARGEAESLWDSIFGK
ncbi:MAG TPA: hypothetical protein ACFYEC_05430 [Candidatus Brocadiaceae bacterium]